MSQLPAEVTLAMPEDEEALMALLRLRHVEEGIGAFDDDAARATVRRGILRDWAYVGVIRERGILAASIGIFVGGFWYSQEPHLTDFWNFVMPDYRRSTHAKNLLMFAKWVSDKLEKPLVMAKVQNEQTSQLLKLYERQLPKSGTLFVYNMPAGQQIAS